MPQHSCSERQHMTMAVYDFGVIMLKDDDNRELRLRPYMSMQVWPRAVHAIPCRTNDLVQCGAQPTEGKAAILCSTLVLHPCDATTVVLLLLQTWHVCNDCMAISVHVAHDDHALPCAPRSSSGRTSSP